MSPLQQFSACAYLIDTAALVQALKQEGNTPADVRIAKARRHLKAARAALARVNELTAAPRG